MTAPGGDGRLIARGFVEVNLKDNTRREMAKLLARLRRQGRPITIPVTVDPRQAQREFTKVFGSMQRQAKPITIPVTVDGRQAQKEMSRVLASAQRSVKPITMPVEVDRSSIAKAERDVREASQRLAAARSAEVDASRELAQAEQRLIDLGRQGTASRRALTQAEQAVTQARERHTTASADLTRQIGIEGGAQLRLTDTKKKYEQASQRGVQVMGNEGRAAAGLNQQLGGLRESYRSLSRLGGKSFLPYGAKLLDEATPAVQKLRDEMHRLNLASRIRPTYEARQVLDEMGQYRTRYFKVNQRAGSFVGEVMGLNAMKSFGKSMRHPALMGPAVAGFVGAFSGAAILAVPAVFAGIAFKILGSTREVSAAFDRLETDVQTALRMDAAPLAASFVTAAARIGQGFQQLRPQLRDVFDAIPPMIHRATTGVLGFSRNAMPGLVTAVRSAGPVVAGLADGFTTAGTGVTRFFTNISTAAPQAGQVFRSLGVIASDIMALFGRLGAEVTKVFGGQVWREAEAIFRKLSNVVGDFAAGALPNLGTGLKVAMNVLSGVLSIIEPFAGIMGSWAGAILGATIAVRGISSALGLLAAAGAVSKFTPLVAAFTRLQLQSVTAGTALAGFTTRMTGSVAAGDRVSNAMGKVSGALSKVGNSLPVIAAAIAAGAFAYDQLSSKADEAAAAVIDGSMTMQTAINTERNQIEKRNAIWGIFADMSDKGAEATRNVTAELQSQMGAMGPLERAQAQVAIAQGKHTDAVRDFGPNSQQARTAASGLADAQQQLGRANDDAEQAARSHTEALEDQNETMMSQIDTGFALRDAISATMEATREAEAALQGSGRESAEYAEKTRTLAEAMIEQAGAERDRAGSLREAQGEQAVATAGNVALSQSLLSTASASGVGRDAFIEIAGTMDQAGLDAISAAADVSGFGTEVLTLPDGRKVTIIAESEREKFDKLQRDLEFAEQTGRIIQINGNAMPVSEVLGQVDAAIERGERFIMINGNRVPIDQVTRQVLEQTNAAVGTIKIDGDVNPANGKITQAVTFAAGQRGSITVDANPDPATGKINGTTTFANGKTGTIQIDGNQVPVNGKIAATVTYANGSTGTIMVDANNVPANAAIGETVTLGNNAYSESTHSVNPGPGNENIRALLNFGNTSTSEGTHNTDPNPANRNIDQTQQRGNTSSSTGVHNTNPNSANRDIDASQRRGNQSRSTSTLNANANPANQSIDASQRRGNQSRSTSTIRANTGPADIAIGALRRWASGPITFVANAIKRFTNAEGNLLQPMADGGVLGSRPAAPMLRFAGGGNPQVTEEDPALRGLRRMSGARAQVIAANTWRVIGDNMRHPELFAPLDGSRRSLDLIRAGAASFDHDVVPRMRQIRGDVQSTVRGAMASATQQAGLSVESMRAQIPSARMPAPATPGPASVPASTPSPAVSGAGATGGGAITINGGVTIRLDGMLDFTNPIAARQIAVRIEEALRNLGRSRQ